MRLTSEKLLRLAAVLALVALLLMMWSLVDPRPAPVLIALSVGQGIGTASFLCFLVVVAYDLHLARRKRLSLGPPSSRNVVSESPAATAPLVSADNDERP